MRIRYCIWVLVLSCVGFQSCKKCMVCANKCYICDKTDTPLCNTDFASELAFDALLGDHANCKQVEPSISYKMCDDRASLENLKQLNEYARYKCN
jgi:hypothetical protein